MQAPVRNISRLRFGTDGKGITSLVAFMGCPLHCRYCINDWCHGDAAKASMLTPEELYRKLRIDSLYFQVTGGGVCFGGGEPTLHAGFIREFRKVCDPTWRITMETALSCDTETIRGLIPVVDKWIVDVKDTNPGIYREYTNLDNDIVSKLRLLADEGCADRTVVRIPHITGYNSDDDVKRSIKTIREMGFNNIDEFRYLTRKTI